MHTEPLEGALKVGVPTDKCSQQEKCTVQVAINFVSLWYHLAFVQGGGEFGPKMIKKKIMVSKYLLPNYFFTAVEK